MRAQCSGVYGRDTWRSWLMTIVVQLTKAWSLEAEIALPRISEGRPIDWVEGSALDLPFPPDSFDDIFCQLGLQFFPDPRRALREMHRVLRGSGRIALSVYSPIERTPGANAFALALDSVLGADASRIKRGDKLIVFLTARARRRGRKSS